MSKYDKLGTYLERQPGDEVPMTFEEIERVTARPLPRSARYPAWWSNNPSNNTMTKVWLRAGFKTEQVSIESRTLVFRRTTNAAPHRQRSGEASMTQNHFSTHAEGMADMGRSYAREHAKGTGAGSNPVHPAFGSMKGLITVMPGVDLTQPADPEWGKKLDRKYGKRGKLS